MLRVLPGIQRLLPGCSSTYLQRCGVSKSVEERLGLPKKPKRPSSAFVKFLSKTRNEIACDNPSATPREIVKIGSDLWKKASESTKTSLKEEYKKEYGKYLEKLENYNQSLTAQQREELRFALEEFKEQKSKKEAKTAENQKIKELCKPVKPLTSFLLYAQSERNNRGELSVAEFQSYLGKKWQNLPDETKRKYNLEAERLKHIYETKLLEWEKKMLRLGHVELVRQKTLDAEAIPDPKQRNGQGTPVEAKELKGTGLKTTQPVETVTHHDEENVTMKNEIQSKLEATKPLEEKQGKVAANANAVNLSLAAVSVSLSVYLVYSYWVPF